MNPAAAMTNTPAKATRTLVVILPPPLEDQSQREQRETAAQE
jgi:hypothetical protein